MVDVDFLVEIVSRFFPVSSSDGQKKRCVECECPLDKTDVRFCSKLCALEGCKNKAKEKGICSYPSCEQRCFVKNHRQHDFCGRTHATEYEKLKAKVVSQSPTNPTRSNRRWRKRPIILSDLMDWLQVHVEGDHKREERKKGTCSYDERTNQRPEVYGTASHEHMNTPILFYSKYEDYYEFTNFAEFPITVDGKKWRTSEHYFQAQKFIGTPYLEEICKLQSPRKAFEFSRKPHVCYWQRGDWEEVKVFVMHKALLAKFKQYKHLRKLLVETGDRILIEHTSNDAFWGDGGQKESKMNVLGKVLMSVRETLKPVPTDGDDNECSDSGSYGEYYYGDCEERWDEIDSCSKDAEMDTSSELVTIQPDNKNVPSCVDNILLTRPQPVESCNSPSHQQHTLSPHILSSTENCGPLFGKGQKDRKVENTCSETDVTLGSEPVKTQEKTENILVVPAEGVSCNIPSKDDKEQD